MKSYYGPVGNKLMTGDQKKKIFFEYLGMMSIENKEAVNENSSEGCLVKSF
jgi:hypothetical protein